MRNPEIERWNQRYQSKPRKSLPSELLLEHKHLLSECNRKACHAATRPKALVLAMGEGVNADHLQKNGWDVTGIDFSLMAVKLAHSRNPQVHYALADLTCINFPSEHFDLLLNFYYLEHSLFSQMAKALKPGGLIFFETFTKEMKTVRPSIRPHHLLEKGELVQAFPTLETLFYEETCLMRPSGRKKFVARYIGQKPS